MKVFQLEKELQQQRERCKMLIEELDKANNLQRASLKKEGDVEVHGTDSGQFPANLNVWDAESSSPSTSANMSPTKDLSLADGHSESFWNRLDGDPGAAHSHLGATGPSRFCRSTCEMVQRTSGWSCRQSCSRYFRRLSAGGRSDWVFSCPSCFFFASTCKSKGLDTSFVQVGGH